MLRTLFVLRQVLVMGLLSLLTALNAWAAPPPLPEKHDEFQLVIKDLLSPERPPAEYAKGRVGRTGYFPINWLSPGQGSYSFLTDLKKIRRAPKEFDAFWDNKRQRWLLQNDSGRALMPIEKSALGIALKDSIVLLDGNHKTLASIYYGAKTMPVHLLADWSHLTTLQAFRELSKRDLIFPYDENGKQLDQLPTWGQLRDNPLRLLIDQMIIKCKLSRSEKGNFHIEASRGSKNPIACKLNRDIPFLELRLALLLHLGGIDYQPSLKKEPPMALTRRARKILKSSQTQNHPALKSLDQALMITDNLKIAQPKNPGSEGFAELMQKIELNLKDPSRCEAVLKDAYF